MTYLSLSGNNTSDRPTVFETHRISRRLLPRGCDFIELTSCIEADSYQKLQLSSTSSWYKLNTNSSIVYTFGIVFMEINSFSMPVSLSGLEVVTSNSGFQLVLGSLRFTESEGTQQYNRHTSQCFSFQVTPKDIHDFISSGSFLLSVFDDLYRKLPEWIRFSKTGTGLLSVTDLRTNLVSGSQIDNYHDCRGAPTKANHFYSVFRFGTKFALSIYGNQIQVPAPFLGKKFCIIIDVCQDNAGTVFLMVPPQSRGFLEKIEFFSNLASTVGLRMRPRGIGLSITNNINVHYRKTELRLWNGDNFFQYP